MDDPQPVDAADTRPSSRVLAAPASPEERLAVVDTLRGFAVFGILLVNMPMFNTPVYACLMQAPWWTSPVDRGTGFLIRVLAEGKFYTLFSWLFGLGMALQMERIEARGGRFVRLYVRRLLVLLVIGLAHGLLLWYGDILTFYALLGFPLLLFRRRTDRTLLTWALVLYFLPVLVICGGTEVLELARLHPEAAVQIDAQFAAQEEYVLSAAQRSMVVYGTGSLPEILRHRLENHRDVTLWATLFILPVVFTLFLLGLYVGRLGILHAPDRHRRLLRWLATWGLLLGLACNVGYAVALEFSSRIRPTWGSFAGFTLYLCGAPLLSSGYAAGIVLLLQREAWRRRLVPLAAVGRMALTNYLLQTVICTTLYYSYGLGGFGKVRPLLGVLLTVVIYLVQVPLSVWWLRRFRFGPLEWLWRSVTYLHGQPMRLAPPG